MTSTSDQATKDRCDPRSSLRSLPPALLDSVDTAIADGATIDEITALIHAEGGTCSRSAVARYARRVRGMVGRKHEAGRIVQGLARVEEACDGGPVSGPVIETLREMALIALADLDENEEPVPPGVIARLALAVHRLESADRFRIEREREAAEAEARATGGPPYSQGLSDEAVAIIRRAVECEFSR